MTELSKEMNWPWLARLGQTLAAVKWRRFVWRSRTQLAIRIMRAANAVATTIAPWVEAEELTIRKADGVTSVARTPRPWM